jgi:hypothetical protein
VTSEATRTPQLTAVLLMREKRDVPLLFGFVHELLRACGTATAYDVVVASPPSTAAREARDAASDVAAAVPEGATFELRLPELDGGVATAGAEGARLVSSSLDWIRKWSDRWIELGGSRDERAFTVTRELDAAASFATSLRALRWALDHTRAQSTPQRLLATRGAERFARVLEGPVVECPSCRGPHAGRACEELLAAAGPGVESLEVESGRRLAGFRAGPGAALHARAPLLDEVQRAVARWDEIVATPWDLGTAPDAFLPPTSPVWSAEARFDEERELARLLPAFQALIASEGGPPFALKLRKQDVVAEVEGGAMRVSGHPSWVQRWIGALENVIGPRFDLELRATRAIQVYTAPSYFLVFKALHWMSKHGGAAISALEVGLKDPEERFELELEGFPARCDACQATHAPGLCERLFARAGPSRIASLAIAPGGMRLEVRPHLLEVLSSDIDRAAAASRIEDWTAIERMPWDVPAG